MSKPWYLGLRKVTFATLTLASITAMAVLKVIDGAQYLGAVGTLTAAFFTANHIAKAKEKANG